MNLELLLEKMPADEKVECEERLYILASTSGIGYQVVANLRCESRLGELTFGDIVQGLLQATADSAEELKIMYIEKCRQHILKGGAIPKPWPLYLGRVVTPKSLYRRMVDLKYFRSENHARSFFRALLSKPLNVVRERLQNKFLGKFVMWATFNPHDLEGNPFDGIPTDVDGIRAHLGLDPNEKGEDLFIFVYALPTDVEPLFPTIADAQWRSLFRPAPSGAKWGLTMPWAEIDTEKPRPEVVHKPIKGVCLTKPIEIRRRNKNG